jgi:hypothetical protein
MSCLHSWICFLCFFCIDVRRIFALPTTPLAPSAQDRGNATAATLATKSYSGQSVLTYLYLAGVEGVGHHGVAPAIIRIAESCSRYVIYQSPQLRRARYMRSAYSYEGYLRKYIKRQDYGVEDVVIFDDGSLPSGYDYRHASPDAVKNHGKYNLEWIHTKNTALGIKVKFLYLDRNFYRAVSSHPEFDQGFEPHAQVLYSFMEHIQREYKIITNKDPDTWRQISYEWFTELNNCTNLVLAVANFLQWDHCDVSQACSGMQKDLRPPSSRPINAENLAIAAKFNTSMGIPVLDIVSPQTPFVPSAADVQQKQDTKAKMTGLTLFSRSPLLPNHNSSAAVTNAIAAARLKRLQLQAKQAHELKAKLALGGTNTPGTTGGITAAPSNHIHININRGAPQVSRADPGKSSKSSKSSTSSSSSSNSNRGKSSALPVVHNNSVTYVMVLGLEGCGLGVLMPLVQDMARSCAQQVIYENPSMRRFQLTHNAVSYQASLAGVHKTRYALPHVTLLEQGSFPAGTLLRSSTYSEKKANGRYNLEWIHEQQRLAGNAVKFLYVTRNFLDVVYAHLKVGMTIRAHADNLMAFLKFFESEYQTITAKDPSAWRQVSFEQFARLTPDSCSSFVYGLTAFLGWEHCDVQLICEHLEASYYPSPPSLSQEIPATDEAFLRAINTTLNIPKLEIPVMVNKTGTMGI